MRKPIFDNRGGINEDRKWLCVLIACLVLSPFAVMALGMILAITMMIIGGRP